MMDTKVSVEHCIYTEATLTQVEGHKTLLFTPVSI